MVGDVDLSTSARGFQEEAQARGEPEDELCTSSAGIASGWVRLSDYTHGSQGAEIQHAKMDRVMLSHLAVYYHG
jgi:hypothetical protein